MTAQIPDRFVLDDREYAVVGVHNSQYAGPGAGSDVLFDPASFGLNPVAISSACWRGYVCQHGIQDDRLVLESLSVALDGPGPEINGVQPVPPPEGAPHRTNVYRDLNLPLEFSGGILIGDEFISELYAHMGFAPAWKFRTVFELVFEKGMVLEIRDVSDRVGQLRREMVKRPLKPGLEAGQEKISSWIESTFRLDYDL
jgi:hypothetical protein